MSMNSWKSMELLAWAPPFSTLSIGTGSACAFDPADGAVERDLQVVRHRLGAGQRDGQDGVGAEPALVRRPVQVDHGVVDRALVEGVQPADGVGDLAVDVGHGLQHALAREAVAAVAQLHRLADAGRRAGGGDGPAPGTGVEQHLGLDGRVAAGVEDLAPDHVLNGAHDISPSASPLVGHRGTTLAVAHLVFGDALGGRRCRRGATARGRAAPVPRRRRAVGPGWPRRRAARPPAPACRRRRRPAGRRPAARCPRRAGRSPASVRADCSALVVVRLQADRACLARQLGRQASGRAGRPGCPRSRCARPFSLFLISSQFATTCFGPVDIDVAEHVRVAVHQLVVHAPRHVGQVELPSSSARRAWKTIWKSRSPSSSSRWA